MVGTSESDGSELGLVLGVTLGTMAGVVVVLVIGITLTKWFLGYNSKTVIPENSSKNETMEMHKGSA